MEVLAVYAQTDQRRLGEAARDGNLPPWPVIESCVRGCWKYVERKNHCPFGGAGDLAHWQQLYRETGGSLL